MNRLLKALGLSLATLALGIFNPVLTAQWVYLGDSQNNYSYEKLNYINQNLCRDAFKIRRQNGRLSIQVASFTTRRKAQKFAFFLLEQVGNSEVGTPTTIVIP